ncbi:IS66 family insertion sequence element accessory protein TnpB [Pseudomonas protegens]|uniref:IS66 family insertion sequence element accessory protein TnpB n=1 Tax=Pseudomonas protegens TaxID=380021 RepID=UPI003FD7BB5A
MFDLVLFVFPNKPSNRVKLFYWESSCFYLWLKRLGFKRFKASPDVSDVTIVLIVQEHNWMFDGFDFWLKLPRYVLTDDCAGYCASDA